MTSLKRSLIFLPLLLLMTTHALAFRGAGREGMREEPDRQREYRQPNHQRPYSERDNHSIRDPQKQSDALAKVHSQAIPTFSNQHYKMNPHSGIPNRDTTNQQNTGNLNSGNNNTVNVNNNGSNWSGSGWNNTGLGVVAGAMFGSAITASVLSANTSPVEINNFNAGTAATSSNQTASNSSSPSNSNKEVWTTNQNLILPKNAVVNNIENGKTTYYCRTNYTNQLVYGVFVPNEGCYIETTNSTMRVDNFDVLTTTP